MWSRRTKFALELNDNKNIMTMADLRDNFDLKKLVDCVNDGKLERWLHERFYSDEADAIENLDVNDVNFFRELCEILGVDYEKYAEQAEILAWRIARLERLKKITDDVEILQKVDDVAFDQEELEDILSQDKIPDTIYLCDRYYRFPSGIMRIQNVRYVGIGKVTVVVESDKEIDFDSLKILFHNIEFERVRGYNKPANAKKNNTNVSTHAEKSTTVRNKNGIHTSQIFVLVQTATKFKSKIQIVANGRKVDAKSMLMVMMLGMVYGTKLTISAEGSDAQKAVNALVNLVDSKFGEE